jgi:hypothetical protein
MIWFKAAWSADRSSGWPFRSSEEGFPVTLPSMRAASTGRAQPMLCGNRSFVLASALDS